jgi:hypothetical protein
MSNIECRTRQLINTDPQRRCYNGCYYSTEIVWSGWETLEWDLDEDKVDERLTFWRELNDYAVSQRGESARREFRIEKL